MLASVTRLRVRSIRYLPAFLWMNFLIHRQVRRARGFVRGRLLVDADKTFWTLTLWQSEKEMKAFRGAAAHAKAMPRLAEWCNEASYAHWSPAQDLLPGWMEAYERLASEGRLSRVNHPSPRHDSRTFPGPRLQPLIGLDLAPVGPGGVVRFLA